jgi:hypothetical protein
MAIMASGPAAALAASICAATAGESSSAETSRSASRACSRDSTGGGAAPGCGIMAPMRRLARRRVTRGRS